MRDLVLILSVLAICAATLTGAIVYKHVNDNSLHCVGGKCQCPCDCPHEPKKPEPFRPRRPGGSTGETGEVSGKVDGVKVRDM